MSFKIKRLLIPVLIFVLLVLAVCRGELFVSLHAGEYGGGASPEVTVITEFDPNCPTPGDDICLHSIEPDPCPPHDWPESTLITDCEYAERSAPAGGETYRVGDKISYSLTKGKGKDKAGQTETIYGPCTKCGEPPPPSKIKKHKLSPLPPKLTWTAGGCDPEPESGTGKTASFTVRKATTVVNGGCVMWKGEGRCKTCGLVPVPFSNSETNFTVIEPAAPKVEFEDIKAVRRCYGTDDPGEITKVKIKATKDIKFTLKIETINGKGDAVFKDGKKKINYRGTGNWDEIELHGKLESTREENIRIWAEYNGAELDEDKFIVFSMIDTGFTSGVTQHKDSDAQHPVIKDGNRIWICSRCYTQRPKPPYPHDHGELNHGQYLWECQHCRRYCARCCLSVINDNLQDFYMCGGTSTLESNHYWGLDDIDITRYGKCFPSKQTEENHYEEVYEQVKKLPNGFYCGSPSHLCIATGCRKNTSEGKITKGPRNTTWELNVWDPQDFPWENKHKWRNIKEPTASRIFLRKL